MTPIKTTTDWYEYCLQKAMGATIAYIGRATTIFPEAGDTDFKISPLKEKKESTTKKEKENKKNIPPKRGDSFSKNLLKNKNNITPIGENTGGKTILPPRKARPPLLSLDEDKKIALLQAFNNALHTSYKILPEVNTIYWLTVYSLEELHTAIEKIPQHHFWKDKMTPTIFFRKKNPYGEPVDYIGDLISYAPKPTSTTGITYTPYVRKGVTV